MPPYSHSVDAVQVFAAAPPAAATMPKKLLLLHPSASSSSVLSEPDDVAPRQINRWQQLRYMVLQLTGLANARDVAEQPSTSHDRRRRSRSLGGTSPILLLHYDFWLEAIDEKHRYGFHLRAFHELWKREVADATEPLCDLDRSFFYWLDYGRGSRVELPNCGRDALNTTLVQYCSHQQRRQFEVEFTMARLAFADSHAPVQTDGLSKWIFVLSQDDKLYVARKTKGFFHHSSFLAGIPVVAAGKIYVADGKIYAIEPHSGHFKPKLSSLTALCGVLQAHGVDARDVHFIKPKKWKDPWPFNEDHVKVVETETNIRDTIDEVSDSEES